jgi:hypothetical protein
MLYEKINFPKLPQHIINDIITEFDAVRQSFVPIEEYDRFLMLPGLEKDVDQEHPLTLNLENNLGFPSGEAAELYGNTVSYFSVMTASEKVHQWLQENLPLDQVFASIHEFRGGNIFFPHVDLMRQTAYNYVIDTGGDNVETVFYEPKPEFAHLEITPRTCIPYDRIQKVNSVICQQNEWYKLDVTNIHSVENIDNTKRRLNLSLSLFSMPH